MIYLLFTFIPQTTSDRSLQRLSCQVFDNFDRLHTGSGKPSSKGRFLAHILPAANAPVTVSSIIKSSVHLMHSTHVCPWRDLPELASWTGSCNVSPSIEMHSSEKLFSNKFRLVCIWLLAVAEWFLSLIHPRDVWFKWIDDSLCFVILTLVLRTNFCRNQWHMSKRVWCEFDLASPFATNFSDLSFLDNWQKEWLNLFTFDRLSDSLAILTEEHVSGLLVAPISPASLDCASVAIWQLDEIFTSDGREYIWVVSSLCDGRPTGNGGWELASLQLSSAFN